jgi:hypothetical protein
LAEQRRVPINAIVAQIDVARLEADEPTGLASAIRQFLVAEVRNGGGPQGPPPSD